MMYKYNYTHTHTHKKGKIELSLKNKPTEELEAILRKDANQMDVASDMELLLPVMEELIRRNRTSNPTAKTAERAYQEFLEHYFEE